ncbi:MAG: hypothetical protein O2V44_04305 [Candidatus Bathyarchaeota archaeon]|nr:hypothetical protein [Candidatus Bathyarchaeota archaeon]
MGRLKKSLIFSSLIVLLTLEALAYPVFPLAFNENSSGVAESSVFPEAVVSYEIPVYQKGLSFSAWSNDVFSSSESDESLRLLTETNTEWIALCFSWIQSNTTSHDIHLSSSGTPTPESIKHAITTAHNLGLKVMLKPMVEAVEREEISSYPVWRGEIQPSTEWFESYSTFINFFAEFAEQNDVELFSVGCEYKKTTGEKDQWEKIISGVRERYSGPITYSADWTNYQNIEWWDSVDYVGIDAYFPLSILKYDPTFNELKNAWTNYADEIETWLSTVNKPVIFTEIGYRSGDGTNMAPSNYWSDMPVDLQEQRDCYEAAFQTLWNRSWFYGFYWWTWIFDPEEGGLNDSFHTPQRKPTQDVITHWYSRDRQVAIIDQTVTSEEKCGVNEVQSVGFHVRWEHDGTDVVDARVYVNGTEHITNRTGWISFSVAYDTVGERSWVVTDFQHPEASGYIVIVESPHIVWDKVVINVEVDSTSFGVSKVRVKVVYAYDGASVTGATTVVNGEVCEEIDLGVYETEIVSWGPYQQLTVSADALDLLGETWTTSTFHVMNTVLYLALFVAVIVIAVLLLKRRRRSSSQTIE